ncbi:hypothetical protein BDW22DRAFT_1459679 [Trametopsis cervina]|nr:hypothetical protein BDW22DRAFT_1459679 [Trametopsis cervina]
MDGIEESRQYLIRRAKEDLEACCAEAGTTEDEEVSCERSARGVIECMEMYLALVGDATRDELTRLAFVTVTRVAKRWVRGQWTQDLRDLILQKWEYDILKDQTKTNTQAGANAQTPESREGIASASTRLSPIEKGLTSEGSAKTNRPVRLSNNTSPQGPSGSGNDDIGVTNIPNSSTVSKRAAAAQPDNDIPAQKKARKSGTTGKSGSRRGRPPKQKSKSIAEDTEPTNGITTQEQDHDDNEEPVQLDHLTGEIRDGEDADAAVDGSNSMGTHSGASNAPLPPLTVEALVQGMLKAGYAVPFSPTTAPTSATTSNEEAKTPLDGEITLRSVRKMLAQQEHDIAVMRWQANNLRALEVALLRPL